MHAVSKKLLHKKKTVEGINASKSLSRIPGKGSEITFAVVSCITKGEELIEIK